MFRAHIFVLLIVTGEILVTGDRISRLEKRFSVLERRMLEDAIAYRDDVEMILKKLDGISNKTSDVSYVRQVEAENVYEKGEPEVNYETFVEIVKETIHEEKKHIRNVLLEARKGTEILKNDFIDMETNVFRKQKELDSMFGQLNQDFILQMAEMQKQYEELDRKVDNNYKGIKELLNDELESKYNELSKEIKSENGQLNSRIDEITNKLRILSMQSCSDGTWDLFGGSCYYVGAEDITWEEAVTKCASLESYLVEVNNDAENERLIKLGKEKDVSGQGAWLGASDSSSEGTWTWETSGRDIVNTYSNFKGSEPNGKTRENCLHLYKAANWNWNDVPCNIRMRYICEKGPLFVKN